MVRHGVVVKNAEGAVVHTLEVVGGTDTVCHARMDEEIAKYPAMVSVKMTPGLVEWGTYFASPTAPPQVDPHSALSTTIGTMQGAANAVAASLTAEATVKTFATAVQAMGGEWWKLLNPGKEP